MPPYQLIVCRNGEPDSCDVDRNPILSEVGKMQSAAMGKHIKQKLLLPGDTSVASGTKVRMKETATIIADILCVEPKLAFKIGANYNVKRLRDIVNSISRKTAANIIIVTHGPYTSAIPAVFADKIMNQMIQEPEVLDYGEIYTLDCETGELKKVQV